MKHLSPRTVLTIVLGVGVASVVVAALAWGRDGNSTDAAPSMSRRNWASNPEGPPSAPQPSVTAGNLPNTPSTAVEYPQVRAAPASGTPSDLAPVASGEGRLAKLYATIEARGWSAAKVPGFPVSALMPPGYFANFRIFNLLDGRQGYSLTVTSYDLDVEKALARPEGFVAPPDRVGVTAQLYPAGSAPERRVFEAITDRFTFRMPGSLAGSFELIQHNVLHPQLGLAGEVVEGSAYAAMPGRRLLVIHASSNSPGNDRQIRELMGVVETLQVE